MTHAELLQRMSFAEIHEWAELYRHDPWGERRDDVRIAIAASAICAAIGTKIDPEKLIPKWGKTPPRARCSSWEEWEAYIKWHNANQHKFRTHK